MLKTFSSLGFIALFCTTQTFASPIIASIKTFKVKSSQATLYLGQGLTKVDACKQALQICQAQDKDPQSCSPNQCDANSVSATLTEQEKITSSAFALDNLKTNYLELESVELMNAKRQKQKCDYEEIQSLPLRAIFSFNGRDAVGLKNTSESGICNFGFRAVVIDAQTPANTSLVTLVLGYNPTHGLVDENLTLQREFVEKKILADCKLKKYGGGWFSSEKTQLDCKLDNGLGRITFTVRPRSDLQ